ncbi:MAG: hypothetical protein P9L99_04930 [Candidatus Lernaella stagnicola]|nr:hypothetical protein [Candidatus Lernaella stagnicola]
MTSRRCLLLVLLLVFLVSACASTSPLATKSGDRKALLGLWEEEWPDQEDHDRYRIDEADGQVTITPLNRTDIQAVKEVFFQHKRLVFTLVLNGSPVRYDLVLVNPTLLAGRAKGGARNFDEPVRWHKKD